MAGEERTQDDSLALLEALAAEPWRFGFFHTLRRLESLHREQPRLGRAGRPADEPIRLGQQPSLAFAPSTLAGLEAGEEGRPARLQVHFMGLLGANGPLPLHLTEFARERQRQFHDATFARFLNVFNHRMLALFYRAWAEAQPTVSLDRPEQDRFADYVGSLFGLGMKPLRGQDVLADHARLFYAGQLVSQNRSPEGLEVLVGDFFRLPARVESFVGHWMVLPEAARCRLGESPDTGTLGMTAAIGERVWDCQYRFRIVLGPVGIEDYRRLLPGGDSLARLVAWVRLYTNDELTWDLQLILKGEEVPGPQLGVDGRLGWTTWLGGNPQRRERDELILDARAYVDGLSPHNHNPSAAAAAAPGESHG